MRACLQEVLPALLKQLQPSIRTVAKQLLNPTEQVLLRTIVSVMTSYGFTFQMGKYGQESEPEDLLQPPIHKLCSFQVMPTLIMYCLAGPCRACQMSHVIACLGWSYDLLGCIRPHLTVLLVMHGSW